jgi:PAS domain S-box-containing protein
VNLVKSLLGKLQSDAILDFVTDGVFTVGADWRIMSFNAAAERITGVMREEAKGQLCCDVFRASICESECALRETLETGNPVIDKGIYVVDAQRQRIPVSISTAILKDKKGNVIGGVETFRDLRVLEELHKKLNEKYTFDDIIGRSAAMRQLFQVVPDIAQSESTILIEGASGTGKELFARAIHDLSERRDKPFVAINCGALPDTLLESELFGYKAGAFTDARRDKPGRFAVANGGTILLDEIGDISPALQSRLLRVLQEHVIEPLGSVKPVPIDVRVVAATNKNLSELVQKKIFREDLYYRIAVIPLRLPLLRERREDIPLLVEHFIAKLNRLRKKEVSGISEQAMSVLLNYDFPGNVRELENIVEYAFVLCHSGLIESSHLPRTLYSDSGDRPPEERRGMTLQELEAVHIKDALRRHLGNRTAAAKELGINPSTLFRKAKSLGIELPHYDGRKRSR